MEDASCRCVAAKPEKNTRKKIIFNDLSERWEKQINGSVVSLSLFKPLHYALMKRSGPFCDNTLFNKYIEEV